MRPNINLVEVYPQLNHNGHLVDGASILLGVHSLWLDE